MTLRTRFAPSPTGYLHIGGARTALYCWLLAKQTKGKFILRIEDTDRERSTQAAIDAILHAMEWLGLNWDEGPFYQMKRLERYHEVADKLIEQGFAYRCNCSKERLEALRKQQMENKEKPRYDGHCRDKQLSAAALEKAGEKFVIRFRNPKEGVVEVDDSIHGKVFFQNSELDDLILIRSDNVPTYNFGVVVDDLDMNITHVLRGDDHLTNTPRQINIIHALGKTPPIYAHMPMILGSDGKRLSKRHGAVSVQHYQEEGILPQALLNYLVRLGWSHGDQEIFSEDEMIQYFDMHNISKSPAAFNPEKLLWLNQHYIKTSSPKDLVGPLIEQLDKIGIHTKTGVGPDLEEVIVALQERATTLKEMAEKSRYFYETPEIPSEMKLKHLNSEALAGLKVLKEEFANIPESDWKKETLHNLVNQTAEKLGIKLGKLAQPLRVAITGGTMSPPIDITLQLIGRDQVLQRLGYIT